MKADRASLLAAARLLLLHISGLILAAGTAAGLSTLFLGSLQMVPAAFLVALAHAVLLGIPCYLVVRARKRFDWWLAPVCGFAIGALPFGLLTLGVAGETEASVDNVAIVIDGVRTLAGWIEYLASVGGAGLLGAAAAFAFAVTVRPTLPRQADGEDRSAAPLRWSPWDIVPLLLAALVILACFVWIPRSLEDRSCHNPMRDGRTSIATQIQADIGIVPADWPALVALVQDFARTNGWSYRDHVQPTGDFIWLDISICNPAGTEFAFQSLGSQTSHNIYLTVFQPQGGPSWRAPFRGLNRMLSARWPGRIQYRDDQGRGVPTPAWLAAPPAPARKP